MNITQQVKMIFGLIIVLLVGILFYLFWPLLVFIGLIGGGWYLFKRYQFELKQDTKKNHGKKSK